MNPLLLLGSCNADLIFKQSNRNVNDAVARNRKFILMLWQT